MSRRSKKTKPVGHWHAPVSAKSESWIAGRNGRWTVPGVCLFLATIVWLVFGQTLGHEFVNYDDAVYVYENPEVAGGLTPHGIVWAFSHVHAFNWHPLTWISHMLDCQFYGLNPSGHHLTNVLLHTLTAILLFLVLRQMTGTLWRSAFVAAIFAIHPLRVESVAWVAERKDVLSGLFFMLTLGAYGRYVRQPSRIEGRGSGAPGTPAFNPRRWTLDYYLVLGFFLLGLMCKPMLVTLPLVLLLLDYWPLNRRQADAATGPIFRLAGRRVPLRLVFEKLPLFGLAVASGVVTIFAQTGTVKSFEQIPLSLRVGNALASYVAYLGQMFWPSGLAVLYPFAANDAGVSGMALSLVLLAGISAGAFILRRQPYLLTGWLWYLIMLVPVIGILQVGSQARADRYTYLPQIGLYLLLTWAAADLCVGWRRRRVVLGGGATIILLALIFCARVQTAYWQNSKSLWTRTLACTTDNYLAHQYLGVTLFQGGKGDEAIVQFQRALELNPGCVDAHNSLGGALLEKGKEDEAIAQFQKALELNPDYVEAHINLGNVLLQKGSVDEAITHFQKVLQVIPDFAEAHYNLGCALLQKGDGNEAVAHFQKALQIKPDYAEAHNNLGGALLQKGDGDEAIAHFQKVLQIKPDHAEAHLNLGNALFHKGNGIEAIAHYQKALEIRPDYAEAQNSLAWIRATCSQASLRNGNQAVELARRANQLTGDENPTVLGTLAAAYAEAGRFPEAVETARRALQLAGTQSNTALADNLRSQMKLYQAGLPFHLH